MPGVTGMDDAGRSSLAMCSAAVALALVTVVLITTVGPPSAAAGPALTESLGSSKGFEYIRAKLQNVTAQAGATASCDAGDSVTGGGGSVSRSAAPGRLNSTAPVDVATAWLAEGRSLNSNGRTVTTYAVCGPDQVTYNSAATTIPQGSGGGLSAPCEAGKTVTGGGVSAMGGNHRIIALTPAGHRGHAWFYYGQNTAPGTTNVTVYAGCIGGYELHYRTERKPAPPGETVKVVAKCRPGQVVLGGGGDTFGAGGPTPPYLKASRPWDSGDRRTVPDDGWLVRFPNEDGLRLQANAVCKS